MPPLLEIRDLTKRFGGVTALNQVTLAVQHGETVGLIGPNGAGKTSLFNCVTGVFRSDAGSMLFGRSTPTSLVGLASHEIAQYGVARTFQNIRLFAGSSVLENVLIGTHARTHTSLFGAIVRPPAARREEQWACERAMELLEFVGLEDRAEALAGSLPFGWQRRLEIARALALDPALLLLDEPAAGLNPVEKQQLVQLIDRLKARHLSMLLIDHDMHVVMPVSDRVAVLDYGRKIAEGTPEVIRCHPAVIEAYLGVESAP